jgi:hypothetical protein
MGTIASGDLSVNRQFDESRILIFAAIPEDAKWGLAR